MASSDIPDQLAPQPDKVPALMERLTEQLAKSSASAVFGEPVTSDGTTVIPVAEVGFGFAGGSGPEAGGAGARARGFIEIRDGVATYKPLRAPWANVAVPLATLLAGAAASLLVHRLATRRSR